MALQSKLSVYLIVEDKIIDYIIYDKLIIEVARRMTKLDIGNFVLTDLLSQYHMYVCLRVPVYTYVYVYVCVFVYLCICVCVCLYVCVHVQGFRDFLQHKQTTKTVRRFLSFDL